MAGVTCSRRIALLSMLAIFLGACGGGQGIDRASGGGGIRASSGGALQYSCGARFSIERLEAPIPDDEIPHRAWEALRRVAERLQPDLGLNGDEDWGAVHYSGKEATFVAEKESRRFPYSSVTVEMSRRRWSFAGAGDCRPSAVTRDDKVAATWRLLDEPDDSDDELRLFATEESCSSGRKLAPEDFDPRVVYESDRILIALLTKPRKGASTCIGNPSTELTLELDEPIGDREIFDAGFYPFRRK